MMSVDCDMYKIYTYECNSFIDNILQRKAYEIDNIEYPTYYVYKDICTFCGILQNKEVKIIYYNSGIFHKFLNNRIISKGTYL